MQKILEMRVVWEIVSSPYSSGTTRRNDTTFLQRCYNNLKNIYLPTEITSSRSFLFNFISKRAENSWDPKRISACYYSFNLRIIYSRICSFLTSYFGSNAAKLLSGINCPPRSIAIIFFDERRWRERLRAFSIPLLIE